MKDITKDDIQSNIPLTTAIKTQWLDEFIAFGPCTVESIEQMEQTAEALVKNGVRYLRGGAFKPLTFPYRNERMYELRLEGVEILKHIKKQYDLKIVSEVTDVSTIDDVIDTFDVLQIGSRNMYNYELLKEVAQSNKPVLLKRHFGASLRDFLGAAEYILSGGNDKVILCERGISVANTHSLTSRFIADIQVIPIIKKYTGLPIVIDPSHATFDSTIVPDMLYAGAAAGADGFIIEAHPTPHTAAVDRQNHISLQSIPELLHKYNGIKEIIDT